MAEREGDNQIGKGEQREERTRKERVKRDNVRGKERTRKGKRKPDREGEKQRRKQGTSKGNRIKWERTEPQREGGPEEETREGEGGEREKRRWMEDQNQKEKGKMK